MDFLKKKMKELMDDNDKDKKPNDGHGSSSQPAGHDTRGYPEQGHGYPPQQQSYPPQGYPNQGQAGGYYDSPAPPQGPPAPYGAPPPMPPGWVQQWDQNSQRWFYIEQATGRSQWDPPAQSVQGPYAPPPGPAGMPPYTGPYAQGGHDERGLFGNTQGVNDQQGYQQGYGGHGSDPYATGQGEKKEKKGHSTAMLAAAGVGGVAAGALIGHELTEDSDDEKHTTSYAAAPAAAAPAAGYGAPPADPGFQEPPPVPTHDADGDSISSSERSSLESQREELIEAQEEYQEELDEAYDD